MAMATGSEPGQTARARTPSRSDARSTVAGALLILVMTLLAYVPATRSGYIWDDEPYVTSNLTLRSADGLRRIWFELGSNPQYYPLVFTTYWLEYRVWGL